MRWTVRNVSDPYDWKVIDSRTGLEIDPNPRETWCIEYVDEVLHAVLWFRESDGLCHLLVAPRVVVDVGRKTILCFMKGEEDESVDRRGVGEKEGSRARDSEVAAIVGAHRS